MVTPPAEVDTEPVPLPVIGDAGRGVDGTGGVDTQVVPLPLPAELPVGSDGRVGSAGTPPGRLGSDGAPGRDGTPEPVGRLGKLGTPVGTGSPLVPVGSVGRLPVPGSAPVGSVGRPAEPVEGSPEVGSPPADPGEETPVDPEPETAAPLPLEVAPVRLDSRRPPNDGNEGTAGTPEGNPEGSPGMVGVVAASLMAGLPRPPTTVPASAKTAAPVAASAVRRTLRLRGDRGPDVPCWAPSVIRVVGLMWLLLIVYSSSRGLPHCVVWPGRQLDADDPW
jgi:hypothetical protein